MTKKLTPREAADYLKRSAKTLSRWRTQGKGPPFIKKEGLVMYDQTVIDRWLEEGLVNSVAEGRYRGRSGA
jgi:hypothetical protein